MMMIMMMVIMMIMRILMLPTNEVGPKRQAGDCSQCASLKEITGQVIIPYPVTVQCKMIILFPALRPASHPQWT